MWLSYAWRMKDGKPANEDRVTGNNMEKGSGKSRVGEWGYGDDCGEERWLIVSHQAEGSIKYILR